MRGLHWRLTGVVIIAAAAGACGASSGVCPGSEQSMGTMSADVDGEAFEACIVQGVHENGLLAVTGQAYEEVTTPLQLGINVQTDSPGTFLFGMDHQGRWTRGLASEDTFTTFLEGTGSVDVTVLDASTAEGTFSFTATNGETEIAVSNGAFSLTF